MGYNILLVAFAVVITGGMGSFTGTFVAAFAMGMVIAITGRFWSHAADTMVFVVMALVLIFRKKGQTDGERRPRQTANYPHFMQLHTSSFNCSAIMICGGNPKNCPGSGFRGDRRLF